MIKQNLYRKVLTAIAVAAFLPLLAQAGPATSFALPDSGYMSNAVFDITEHNGAVWCVTGEGVMITYDNGDTWYSYDASNGLVGTSASAILSIPAGAGDNRIWVATSHEEMAGERLYSLSDGIQFSDNDGEDWTRINFGSDGLNIPYVWGVDRTIFEITGHFDENDPDDDWLFFTAFAGGFLASRDGGMNWRRIYPTAADSVQFSIPDVVPSLRNRNFSCAADTSHADSLFMWVGTAGGFFQYVFAPPREKVFSEWISRVVFCDTCPCEGCDDSNFVYFGGEAGFSRATKTGGPFISRFESDGLPGQSVISLIDFGGKLFAGTINPLDSSGTGLAVSEDFGETFTASTSFDQTGINKRILDFAAMGDRLYLAAEEAGLWVTDDTGTTWTPVVFDGSDPANRRNVVHALNAWGDTLRLGTDSGLVNLFLSPMGTIDDSLFTVFPETESSSARIVRVKTQIFGGVDVIWTAHRPLTLNGTPMVGRSADGGVTFDSLQVTAVTYDFAFFGDTAFVVGEEGIRFSPDGTNPGRLDDWIVRIREYSGNVVVDSLISDTLTAMEVLDDTVFIATNDGYAVSFDRGETYDIHRTNTDTLKADAVLHYTYAIEGLLGNFIPEIGVQYMPDTLARVWISNRPADFGSFGISVGRIDMAIREITDPLGVVIGEDTIYIYNWDAVYDDFAWNFAFNGDTVFAATSEGLIYASSDSLIANLGDWHTLDLVNSAGAPLVLEGSPVYAVAVVGDYLWVGTSDRTVRVDLNNYDLQQPYFVQDPVEEVYAFPVPYSHTIDLAIDFHFVVEEPTDVTIEVYDFAMNLVRRVADNERFEPGIYPTVGGGRPTWDGRNGKGEEVAVGIYYFKIEFSTGQVRWGKLAVIP
ncbi:MAG: hypothetical protein JSV52_03830 [Candidatus Zixiibacteriota bacterium]|nr:MAG: hypothetical protein JSV52_03830 [candidate division Zixibacteria bacterium]